MSKTVTATGGAGCLLLLVIIGIQILVYGWIVKGIFALAGSHIEFWPAAGIGFLVTLLVTGVSKS